MVSLWGRVPLTIALALFALALTVGCSRATGAASPEPTEATTSATTTAVLPTPTGPDVEEPVESPEPGFTFPPLPETLTRSNVVIFANKMLYERTGRLCVRRNYEEPATKPDWDEMARDLPGGEGLLADGRTYVGPLAGILNAFELEETNLVVDDVAYGIGQVQESRALPNRPEGAWWLPEFERIQLRDGRSGWTWTGSYFLSPSECSIG